MKRIFTRVSYQQFRQYLAGTATQKVKSRGFETAIFDQQGDILAIVHAASIDAKGKCHPAEYYIRTTSLGFGLATAA
jgi:hypothetical protein